MRKDIIRQLLDQMGENTTEQLLGQMRENTQLFENALKNLLDQMGENTIKQLLDQMKENTIKQLLDDAITVIPGTEDFWPAKPEEPSTDARIGSIDMTPEINQFNGGKVFSIKGYTVGIISDDKYYAIPATRARIKLLRANGFKLLRANGVSPQSQFYVPFSFGDFPNKFQEDWLFLTVIAILENRKDFPDACESICKAKGVHNIDSLARSKFFEIPEEGMEVLKPSFAGPIREFGVFTEEDRARIMIEEERAATKLGMFTTFNGVTIFASTRGESFLTKEDIAEDLRLAGYKETPDLFVPLSSGGIIVNNDELAEKWDAQ